MRRLVMFVVLAAFAASLLIFARRSPVQYKVWIMDPPRCAELTIPEPILIYRCLDSVSFRGRAGPLLHAALAQGMDSADVAGLADSAMIRTNGRASRTKAPEDYQEAVALGQFADSIHAKLSRGVARRPAPAGGSAAQKR
jgi:hypothetical protein